MTSLWLETARLADGWASAVRLTLDAGGMIAGIETGAAADGCLRVAGATIPAAANLHSHAFQRAMAGLTERQSAGAGDFWAWRSTMYAFIDKLTPDDVEAIATQLYVEMLRAGYSSVCEFHYLHHDLDGSAYGDPAEMAAAIVRAADTAGIGLTLVPVLYMQGGFGGVPAEHGQRRFLLQPDRFLSLLQSVQPLLTGPARRLAMALHSLRAVPPEAMREVLAAVPADMPVHVHVAEQLAEIDACLAWSGKRPVEWLHDQIGIDRRWCLVHATHMTQAEATATAKSGATVAICSSTEGNLGDGFFPADSYFAAGGKFGIGSDSHVSTSPVEELRWLEYGRRLCTHRRAVSAGDGCTNVGAWLWNSAADAGAVTGRPTGQIAVGHAADLVVLDPAHPTLAGRSGDLLLDSLVFSGNGSAVRDVLVGGHTVIRDRQGPQQQAIAERYLRTIERLVA